MSSITSRSKCDYYFIALVQICEHHSHGPFSLYPRNHREHKKNQIPETKTEEGSARRNIIRKHDQDPNRKEKKQGGGGGGKGKWNNVDDGSMESL